MNVFVVVNEFDVGEQHTTSAESLENFRKLEQVDKEKSHKNV